VTHRRRVLVSLVALGLFTAACSSSSDAAQFGDDVEAAVAFVEEVRGLTLDQGVPVRVLDEAEMEEEFRGSPDPPDYSYWLDTQSALGFAIPDDYASLLSASSLPAGLYRPEHGEIVVLRE
jgi:hypothetical protein